jgi:hypothetical protein
MIRDSKFFVKNSMEAKPKKKRVIRGPFVCYAIENGGCVYTGWKSGFFAKSARTHKMCPSI